MNSGEGRPALQMDVDLGRPALRSSGRPRSRSRRTPKLKLMVRGSPDTAVRESSSHGWAKHRLSQPTQAGRASNWAPPRTVHRSRTIGRMPLLRARRASRGTEPTLCFLRPGPNRPSLRLSESVMTDCPRRQGRLSRDQVPCLGRLSRPNFPHARCPPHTLRMHDLPVVMRGAGSARLFAAIRDRSIPNPRSHLLYDAQGHENDGSPGRAIQTSSLAHLGGVASATSAAGCRLLPAPLWRDSGPAVRRSSSSAASKRPFAQWRQAFPQGPSTFANCHAGHFEYAWLWRRARAIGAMVARPAPGYCCLQLRADWRKMVISTQSPMFQLRRQIRS